MAANDSISRHIMTIYIFSRPDAGFHILEPRILQGHYDTSLSPIVCGLVRMRSNLFFVVDVKSYNS